MFVVAKPYSIRTLFGGLVIALTLIFLFRTYSPSTNSPFHIPDRLSGHDPSKSQVGPVSPSSSTGFGKKVGKSQVRIGKTTMLYGAYNDLYERAVRTHELHGKRHGYEVHVLRNQISQGYWNKPAWVLSLVVRELAKAPEERAHWLMWFDADSLIVNPAVPLDIFLPPPDFDHIHFVGNKDQNGLNTGTFFIRVSEWSVKFLSKSLAFPQFRTDIDLGTSPDQVAMDLIFNETEFAPNVIYQPRPWFNTYQFRHGYEGKKGDLLVHFPGLEDARWQAMNDWLDIVETRPREWEVDLDQTDYPKKIADWWAEVRRGREYYQVANEEASHGAPNEELGKALKHLHRVLENETDRIVAITEAIEGVEKAKSPKQAVSTPDVGHIDITQKADTPAT
ncbi:MAG: hypothetical protein M1833_004193 [Piccolia ochrophora]|nr:MAG: hypothetical protein M1833_004193 [Piccolia ochrophora]